MPALAHLRDDPPFDSALVGDVVRLGVALLGRGRAIPTTALRDRH